jgi:hypothetical protein
MLAAYVRNNAILSDLMVWGLGMEYDALYDRKPSAEPLLLRQIGAAQSKITGHHLRTMSRILNVLLDSGDDPRTNYVRETVFGIPADEAKGGIFAKTLHIEKLRSSQTLSR